jgi:hypothetical protein
MTERLLAALQSRTNDRGLMLASEDALCDELRVTPATLGEELQKLEAFRLVEVLAPLPFLVARLRGTWPGSKAKTPDSGLSAYSAIQLLNKQQLNSSYRRTGAHWPIDAALLGEILETLGETDGKSFEKAVELYSPHVIRTALDRVRRARGIRKNRTALFRHLLPRLAHDEHRFHQVT